MFMFISKKTKNNFLPMNKNVVKSLEPFQEVFDKGNKWIEDKYKNNEIKDVYIKSKDNLKLHAIFVENKKNKGIVIETHGYRSKPQRDLYAACHEYYNMGYSLLLVDSRACGQSEGKYITFGIKESEDLINWIKYLNKNYKDKSIILAGVSMGATTILMSLKDIKKNMHVKCVISDCAYIIPKDEILYCIKNYFHINGKIFINMINIWSKLIAKFDLKEKDTITSLKNTNIPILFIHGKDDDFVPVENTNKNYELYKGTKEILLIDDANHGLSYLIDPNKYIKTVTKFIKKYNK